MAKALHATMATRILVLNLKAQSGETSGYLPTKYLEVMAKSHPEFRLDHVIADPGHVGDEESLIAMATKVGAQVHFAKVGTDPGPSDQHDSVLLASAFNSILTHGRIDSWQ
jgi:hypothetical protein